MYYVYLDARACVRNVHACIVVNITRFAGYNYFLNIKLHQLTKLLANARTN